MSATDAPPSALPELKKFLEFLSGMWGLLAGISTLFPLSNLLLQAVPLEPLPEGGFAYLPATAVSVVATLCCVFVVLWTFSQRGLATSWTAAPVQRRAWRSFILGLAGVILYFALYLAIANDFYWVALGWQSGDLRRLAGDVVLLILYAALFSLLTRAFVLLALFEFVKPRT